MDTAKRGNKEVQERIVILQKEKDHLTLEYRDKRKMVDDIKENLQKKINEYSKMAESSKNVFCLNSTIGSYYTNNITLKYVTDLKWSATIFILVIVFKTVSSFQGNPNVVYCCYILNNYKHFTI